MAFPNLPPASSPPPRSLPLSFFIMFLGTRPDVSCTNNPPKLHKKRARACSFLPAGLERATWQGGGGRPRLQAGAASGSSRLPALGHPHALVWTPGGCGHMASACCPGRRGLGPSCRPFRGHGPGATPRAQTEPCVAPSSPNTPRPWGSHISTRAFIKAAPARGRRQGVPHLDELTWRQVWAGHGGQVPVGSWQNGPPSPAGGPPGFPRQRCARRGKHFEQRPGVDRPAAGPRGPARRLAQGP